MKISFIFRKLLQHYSTSIEKKNDSKSGIIYFPGLECLKQTMVTKVRLANKITAITAIRKPNPIGDMQI